MAFTKEINEKRKFNRVRKKMLEEGRLNPVPVKLKGVALAKYEMLLDQGYEVCGLLVRRIDPTGVKVSTLSMEARVAWLDPVSVLGADGVLKVGEKQPRMDTDGHGCKSAGKKGPRIAMPDHGCKSAGKNGGGR